MKLVPLEQPTEEEGRFFLNAGIGQSVQFLFRLLQITQQESGLRQLMILNPFPQVVAPLSPSSSLAGKTRKSGPVSDKEVHRD